MPRPASPPPAEAGRDTKKIPGRRLSQAGSREPIKKAASYSPALLCSTIGAGGLNFSVRNGKRWDPAAIATRSIITGVTDGTHKTRQRTVPRAPQKKAARAKEDFGQLVALGFDVAVFTPAPYQRRSLRRPSSGALILRTASRLDAFSAYPDQTRLPGGAPGGTTGRPEVCPPRSSRTSGGPAQDSSARDR